MFNRTVVFPTSVLLVLKAMVGFGSLRNFPTDDFVAEIEIRLKKYNSSKFANSEAAAFLFELNISAFTPAGVRFASFERDGG